MRVAKREECNRDGFLMSQSCGSEARKTLVFSERRWVVPWGDRGGWKEEGALYIGRKDNGAFEVWRTDMEPKRCRGRVGAIGYSLAFGLVWFV